MWQNKNRNQRNYAVHNQTTLAAPVLLKGVGMHSGKEVTIHLFPAPPHHGICFERVDLPLSPRIPALWSYSIQTPLCTRIQKDGVFVNTIEHLMAALRACEIDNVLVQINGEEVPILDGSAEPFILELEKVGTSLQEESRSYIKLLKPVEIKQANRFARLEPAAHFSIKFSIDFQGRDNMPVQNILFDGDMDVFQSRFSSARTYGFLEDAEALRAAGLAKGASLENAVVLKQGMPINPGGFRFQDECVRHKVLDALGDLFLAGAPLLAQYHGFNSGHEMNSKLLNEVFQNDDNWCFVTLPTAADLRPYPEQYVGAALFA